MFLLFPAIVSAAGYTQLITFDDYPDGTPITEQYQSQGIIFSGGDYDPPVILTLTDGTGTLTGGIITGTFVEPGDPSRLSEVTSFSFGYSMIWTRAVPTTITYYDIYGVVVREDTYASWLDPPEPPYVPQNFHKFVIQSGGFTRIDDLRFTLSCPGTDADGDGHYTPDSCRTPNDDCDDTDPSIPGPELCGDGIDNNCDGNADCLDVDCAPDPECFPRDCSGTIGD